MGDFGILSLARLPIPPPWHPKPLKLAQTLKAVHKHQARGWAKRAIELITKITGTITRQ